MRAARTLCLLLSLAAAGAVAACASNAPGSEGGSVTFAVPVEVDNNLTGFQGVTVYMTRSSGTGRRLLGPVEAGQKRGFNYDATVGTYRLIARRGASQDSLVSEQFQLSSGLGVLWTLQTNRVITAPR